MIHALWSLIHALWSRTFIKFIYVVGTLVITLVAVRVVAMDSRLGPDGQISRYTSWLSSAESILRKTPQPGGPDQHSPEFDAILHGRTQTDVKRMSVGGMPSTQEDMERDIIEGWSYEGLFEDSTESVYLRRTPQPGGPDQESPEFDAILRCRTRTDVRRMWFGGMTNTEENELKKDIERVKKMADARSFQLATRDYWDARNFQVTLQTATTGLGVFLLGNLVWRILCEVALLFVCACPFLPPRDREGPQTL